MKAKVTHIFHKFSIRCLRLVENDQFLMCNYYRQDNWAIQILMGRLGSEKNIPSLYANQ